MKDLKTILWLIFAIATIIIFISLCAISPELLVIGFSLFMIAAGALFIINNKSINRITKDSK